MKQLDNGTTPHSGWSNSLIDDLDYIKRKLRYPVKRVTVMPVIMWTAFILLMMLLASISIYTWVSDSEHIPGIYLILAASMIILFLSNIIRYLQSLRFMSLHTGKYLEENIRLLDAFLKSQQMLTFRHPEAPEVFQIQSRNLSAGKEDREIIVFIATDKSVLINSHFSNKGWGFSPAKRHHTQMAKMLHTYLQQANRGTSVLPKTF